MFLLNTAVFTEGFKDYLKSDIPILQAFWCENSLKMKDNNMSLYVQPGNKLQDSKTPLKNLNI